MSIIILILIAMTFVSSIAINIFLYLELKEVRIKWDLNENSIKMWLDDEVKMKRIYKNLYEKLSKDLNNINERFNSLRMMVKPYRRIIKRFKRLK